MLKRIITLALMVIFAVLLAACGGSAKGTSASTSSQRADKAKIEFHKTDENFNPLEEKDALTFAKMREQFGPIPKMEGELKFAGNVKAFENVVWRQFADGYTAFAENAKKAGVNLIIETRSPQGENDEEGQLTILRDQIRKKYDAILLSPISDGNCLPGVDEAHKAGIPVFAVNNEFNGADIFIGPNAIEQGVLAAEWISKTLGGKGKVAIVMGMPKTAVTRYRTDGFEKWIKENAPGIEVVEKQNADWDRSKAKDVAQTWLKKYPDLKAIYCNNDVMAMGVIEAVKEANLKLNKDIYVVGTDGQKEAYKSIKNGELAATVDIFPFYQGQIAAEVAMRVLAGQKIPRVIWTPQLVIDSSNVNKSPIEILGWKDPEFK